MKAIKVIDLLNMVFNDELKENALIKFNYDSNSCEYWRYINGEFLLCYDKGKTETDDWIDVMSYLTEKQAVVEIIEDNPTKIKEMDMTDTISDYILADKINELVRTVNDLVKRDTK